MPPPAPTALRRAMVALEQSGIPAAQLREFEGSAHFVEVDLLVPRRTRPELNRTLVPLGFAPMRAWGHSRHRFYLCYSTPDHLWVKLDFVTGIPGVDVEQVLAARRLAGGIPRLAPAHEAALLLIHCVLDKGGRPGRHRPALRRWSTVPPDPPPGAPDELDRVWPELWRAVAAAGEGLPEQLVREVVGLLAPGQSRRARLERWSRRASYIRRALRPVAPTVALVHDRDDGRTHKARRVVLELGPGARSLRVPGGGGHFARARRRLAVELARRSSDGPVVVAAFDGAVLPRADVVIAGGAERVGEAVWPAYRRRMLG
jgi:hypothetical protein